MATFGVHDPLNVASWLAAGGETRLRRAQALALSAEHRIGTSCGDWAHWFCECHSHQVQASSMSDGPSASSPEIHKKFTLRPS